MTGDTMNFGGLMKFLREDREYSGKKSSVKEDGRTEFPIGRREHSRSRSTHLGSGRTKDQGAHKLFQKRFEDLTSEEREDVLSWVKETKEPDPTRPNVDHESVGVETYEDDDLNKVKSQTPKNKKFAVRQVKDKEVETPIPTVKSPTKESRTGTLYLCNECYRTFRNIEAKCIHCPSTSVESIVTMKLAEGVSELIGELEGMTMEDQAAVRKAIEAGQISDEWPNEGDMIDALSSLEDIVDPTENPDADIKLLYFEHVLIPKALSVQGEASEGKVPSDKDDEQKIIQKLIEDKDEWRAKVVTPLSEALENTNLGYYHSSSRKAEDGTLVYEFTSVGGGPAVEVHVKSEPVRVEEDVRTLPSRRPSTLPDEEEEEIEVPTREKRPHRVTPLKPEPGQHPGPKGSASQNPDVVLFKKMRK